MKLKEYLDCLNELVKKNPEYNNLDVVYSSDDEGNRYSNVHFHPTVGTTEGNRWDMQFYSIDPQDSKTPTAICIN